MNKLLNSIISLAMCGLILFPQTYMTVNAENNTETTVNSIKDDTTYKCSDTINCSLTTEGVLTISGTGDIPDESTHYYNTQIKSIIIEDGITSIGANCFKEFPNLESVTLGKDVAFIGSGAFYNCKKLKTVTLNEGLETINDRVFDDCESLTSINFPSTLNEIGDNAFVRCYGLKNIKLNKGLKVIGESAFNSCIGLTKVDIPDTVTTIKKSAFNDSNDERNMNIESFTIPKSVTTIEDSALGIHCRDGGILYTDKDFTIYGYKGSEAENYVNRTNMQLDKQFEKYPNDDEYVNYRLSFVALDGENSNIDASPKTGDSVDSILMTASVCIGLSLMFRKRLK